MVNYTLPQFNLLGDQWWVPNKPSLGPADALSIPVQLYVNSRDFNAFFEPILRFPVAAPAQLVVNDVFEIPQASGKYYKVARALVVHQGLVNEYWACIAVPCDAAATTIIPFLP